MLFQAPAPSNHQGINIQCSIYRGAMKENMIPGSPKGIEDYLPTRENILHVVGTLVEGCDELEENQMTCWLPVIAVYDS